MRSLIVDDELTSRIVLEQILQSYGEVDCAQTGVDAVDACRRALELGRPYDVVCMDIVMPGLSGLDALKLIRESEDSFGRTRQDAARIIMITGRDDSESISLSFQQLCDAYLTKPLDVADFLGVLHCLHPMPEPHS